MADTYEKDLAQKSSLTTSDYIRVVGSDNVSYKQGVPSVLAGMGLSLYYTDTNSTSDGSTDSDRYKMSFQRVLTTFSNSSPTVNRTYPIMIVTSGTSAGTFAGVVNVTSTAMRFLVSYGNSNYSGQFVRSSNTINAFERMPYRAEVDALTNKSIQLTWGASVSFTCATNHRFLMIAGTNTLYTGVNYSDSLTFSKVAGADSLTFTASKNGTTITITASASTNISVLVF